MDRSRRAALAEWHNLAMEPDTDMKENGLSSDGSHPANSDSVRSLSELIVKNKADTNDTEYRGPGLPRPSSDKRLSLKSSSSSDVLMTQAQIETAPLSSVPGIHSRPKKSCLKIRVTKVNEEELRLDPEPGNRIPIIITDDDDIDEAPDSPPVSPGSLRVRRDSLALAKLNIESTTVKKKRFHKPPEYKLKIAVSVMFVFIVTSIAVIVHFYHKQQHIMTLSQRIVFDDYNRLVKVKRGNEVLVTGTWGMNMASGVTTYDCTLSTHLNSDTDLCLQWSKQGHVLVQKVPLADDKEGECFSVSWLVEEGWPDPLDCFSMEGAYWYGGSLVYSQRLSLVNTSIPMAPYLTGTIHDASSFGPVMERMWITSKGIAIYVDDETPLHVSVNAPIPNTNDTDMSLCLNARYEKSPYQNHDKLPTNLKYTICLADSARAAHKLVNVTKFDLDSVPGGDTLKAEMFEKPVWSTWAYLKENITADKIIEFAESVHNHSYGHHLLAIDDGWQSFQSDLRFNTSSFPNSTTFLDRINSLGFATSLQVHPYINTRSRLFQEAVDGDYLVLDQSRKAPGLVRWYNGPHDKRWDRGVAAVVDMNRESETWWGSKLEELITTLGHGRVGGYRFDMGEVDMLPYLPVFQAQYSNPNRYTQAYASIAADSKHGDYPQIRAAYRAQETPCFVRIYGKNSTWGYNNGLKTIIPTAVTLGLLGYPFIEADAIGGNAFSGTYPSEELYIRWMQITTFLPIMHFSIPPHYYSDKVVELAKYLIQLHKDVVYPEIRKLIDNSSYPLIRPLWWDNPMDDEALWLEDEFFVGPDILVAPVVNEGSLERDIYLPRGSWVNCVSMVTHNGPGWLNVQIPLDKIVFFQKKK